MSLPSSSEEPKSARPGRGLLFAGVAAAALMGVGFGLWARPAMSERQMALPPVEAPAPPPTRGLQIILDDKPAPLGAPIEVLPRSAEAPKAAPPPEPPAREFLAPVRSAVGLVRVQSVEPEPEPVEPPPPTKTVRRAEAEPAPKVAVAKAVKIKAVATPKPKPPTLVKPSKLERPPKLEKVKAVETTRSKPAVNKVARADPKPAKVPARLAKVDRPQKPARIEKAILKRPPKLSGLAHAIEQAAPRKPVASQKAQKIKLDVKKATRPQLEKVAQKPKRPAAPPPTKAFKPAKGAGPLRIAKAPPRPDTAIRDADRQMDRAYSSARAAGVPDWQLRKQQARWEAARASAAREAPWAVHDVYLARIAELHDLTKDAQASGN